MSRVLKDKDVRDGYADLYEASQERLRCFWIDNIGDYFNKTNNAFMLTKTGSLRQRIAAPSTNMKLLKYALDPHYLGKVWRFNMHDMYHGGREYGAFLRNGTPNSPGTFIPEIGKRSNNIMSTRKGTTSDQWRDWLEIFNAEVEKEMEIVATQIAERTGDIVTSAVSHKGDILYDFAHGRITDKSRVGRLTRRWGK